MPELIPADYRPRCGNCHAIGHWMDQCESSRPTPDGEPDDA